MTESHTEPNECSEGTEELCRTFDKQNILNLNAILVFNGSNFIINLTLLLLLFSVLETEVLQFCITWRMIYVIDCACENISTPPKS